MNERHIFAGLDGAPRSRKPRASGLTMVVDWGLGPGRQNDLTATAAPYIDFAKIAVGLSRLLADQVLVEKIDAYRSHRIEPFPGGQYLEYAQIHGEADLYLPACQRAGYRWIEVSDNVADVPLEWKVRVIEDAVTSFGMGVLGEVGKKEGLSHGPSFPDDARACLDAGASIILLEAAELVHANDATRREIDETVAAVGLDRVMFELPGPWISGVQSHDIHRMRRDLVDRFGPEVNVGNVMPEDSLPLEAYRRELGINAGKGPAA